MASFIKISLLLPMTLSHLTQYCTRSFNYRIIITMRKIITIIGRHNRISMHVPQSNNYRLSYNDARSPSTWEHNGNTIYSPLDIYTVHLSCLLPPPLGIHTLSSELPSGRDIDIPEISDWLSSRNSSQPILNSEKKSLKIHQTKFWKLICNQIY